MNEPSARPPIGMGAPRTPVPVITKPSTPPATTAAPAKVAAPASKPVVKTTAAPAAAKPVTKAPSGNTLRLATAKVKRVSKAVREAEALVKAAQAVLTAAREHQLSEERLAKAKESYKNLAKS